MRQARERKAQGQIVIAAAAALGAGDLRGEELPRLPATPIDQQALDAPEADLIGRGRHHAIGRHARGWREGDVRLGNAFDHRAVVGPRNAGPQRRQSRRRPRPR